MKKIYLIICFAFLLCLCGCWNYHELDQYSIVTGMAIDLTDEGKYEISLLISNVKKQESDSSDTAASVAVLTDEGDSVYEAIKNIGLISPKELYIGHLSIVVISDDIAKNGLKDSVDFLLREPESRKNFYVIISQDSKAKDTLSIMSALTDFPSQNISDGIETTSSLQGMIQKTSFNDLIKTLLASGKELTMSSVTVVGDTEKGEQKKNVEATVADSYIKLNTLGIFKDDKLIEWADDEESVGINLITSDINEAYFQVDCDDDYFVINTENLKRKISEELDNGIPKIKIMMDFEVIVAESTCSVDILNEDNVENLEKLSETKIEEVIRSAIDLSKDNKTDILGFGRLFYMNHNSYYENVKDKWNDEIFPNLAVDVDINVKINSTGTAKLTLEVDKNE